MSERIKIDEHLQELANILADICVRELTAENSDDVNDKADQLADDSLHE